MAPLSLLCLPRLSLSPNQNFKAEYSNPENPSQGPSRLLALPSELRNIIFEYALTEESPLVFVRFKSRKKLHGFTANYKEITTYNFFGTGIKYIIEKLQKANQLKLVCRQLYNETTGLSLRFNAIEFQSKHQIRAFKNFLGSASNEHHRHITKVFLTDNSYHFTGFLKLLKLVQHPYRHDVTRFASAYPNCTITMYMRWFNSKQPVHEWLIWASILYWGRYGKMPHILPACLGPLIMFHRTGGDEEFPSNVKMVPQNMPNWKKFVEGAFRPRTGEEVREVLGEWCANGLF